EILHKLKEHDINVYIIAGSHDYSSAGKTMLDVLEKAGLVENVTKIENNKLKITMDKTNTKISGLFGLKGGLEKKYYQKLDFSEVEKENGFKIFMFHTALNEFKPKELEMVEGLELNKLPKNFDYYAGGHVHYIYEGDYDKGKVVFPGALFPNNFKELEEFNHGSFYLVDDKLNLRNIRIKLKDVLSVFIGADGKSSEEVEHELMNIKDYEDKIVTIRIEGVLKSGKVSDIDFKKVLDNLNGAYVVLRNTNKLRSKEVEDIKIEGGNIENLEEDNIKEIISEDFNEEFIKNLISLLDKDKKDGERNIDFESRIIKEIKKILNLEI
ncbi:MAG: hypothetical protein ISS82_05715, partial [Nanoarchaeota archaeon]|nr:hypothetical protein [Nanoarchaeota archaeon]